MLQSFQSFWTSAVGLFTLALAAVSATAGWLHRDQPVVKCLHPELLHREAEGGMGADQHPGTADALVGIFSKAGGGTGVPSIQKRLHRIDLAGVFASQDRNFVTTTFKTAS